jgi:hypothetical protein
MRPIPISQRVAMASDPYYSKCCYSFPHACVGKIEWHHNNMQGGKQNNDIKTILPICQTVHRQANNKEIKEKLDFIMLSRMSPEERKSISKAVDYEQRFQYIRDKETLCAKLGL